MVEVTMMYSVLELCLCEALTETLVFRSLAFDVGHDTELPENPIKPTHLHDPYQ